MSDVGPDLSYGTSQHYMGSAGDQYAGWQLRMARSGAAINTRKFAPFITATDTVLDFGCGGGRILTLLECARRLGVEVNPTARAEAIATGIECVESATEIPDHVADVVMSHHALEHVPYPIEALAEMGRILKPSGRLLLYVPIDDWRAQKRYDPADRNHHLNTWTPQLLGNTLTEAGFAVAPADIQIVTHAWPPHFERLDALLPTPLFDRICGLWAMLRHRRQLFANVGIAG